MMFIMPIEIELKAHVRDIEAFRPLFADKAGKDKLISFEKEDCYWQADTLPYSRLRVRKEKRVFPDGKVETYTLINYKIKEIRDGIEVNDEREFEINPRSYQNGQEIEELLKFIGLKPIGGKRKRGWTFSEEGLNAELSEVEELGWFVELEILADNNREDTYLDGKKRLLCFLDSLGIKRDAIESRPYTEMLREARECGNKHF